MTILKLSLFFLEYDGLYHYWNPRTNQFQNVTMTNLFRSNYTNVKAPQPPPTTLYTQIKLRTVFILFWNGYLLYGIFLTLIKNYINKNFAMASLGKKLQHIIEAVNMPEAFGDWDSDNSLTIKGHKELWNKILAEMMIMVGLQCLTNMILLTPLLITGRYIVHAQSKDTIYFIPDKSQTNSITLFFN